MKKIIAVLMTITVTACAVLAVSPVRFLMMAVLPALAVAWVSYIQSSESSDDEGFYHSLVENAKLYLYIVVISLLLSVVIFIFSTVFYSF